MTVTDTAGLTRASRRALSMLQINPSHGHLVRLMEISVSVTHARAHMTELKKANRPTAGEWERSGLAIREIGGSAASASARLNSAVGIWYRRARLFDSF